MSHQSLKVPLKAQHFGEKGGKNTRGILSSDQNFIEQRPE